MKNTQEPQSLPLTLPHQRAKILNQTQALTNPSAYHFYLTSVNFSPRFNQLLKFWFLIINRHTAYFIKSFKWCFLQFITNRGLSFFSMGECVGLKCIKRYSCLLLIICLKLWACNARDEVQFTRTRCRFLTFHLSDSL